MANTKGTKSGASTKRRTKGKNTPKPTPKRTKDPRTQRKSTVSSKGSGGAGGRVTTNAARRRRPDSTWVASHSTLDIREMFWNNVIRDILMALSVMKVRHDEAIRLAKDHASVQAQTAKDKVGRTITGPHFDAFSPWAGNAPVPDGTEDGEEFSEDHDNGIEEVTVEHADLAAARALEEGISLSGVPPFDGRMGVITTQGVRIGIADVYPLFACSIGGTELERVLSEEVQCSVFQIRSPQGEVYTLPVHEIRSFHALTEELMAQIAQASALHDEDGNRTVVPFGFGAFTALAREAQASASDDH